MLTERFVPPLWFPGKISKVVMNLHLWCLSCLCKWNEYKSNFQVNFGLLQSPCSSNQAAQLDKKWPGWHSCWGPPPPEGAEGTMSICSSAISSSFKGTEGQWLGITSCKCSHYQGVVRDLEGWQELRNFWAGEWLQTELAWGCAFLLPFLPLAWEGNGWRTRGAQSQWQSYDTFKKCLKIRTCKSAGLICLKIFLSSCNKVSWIVQSPAVSKACLFKLQSSTDAAWNLHKQTPNANPTPHTPFPLLPTCLQKMEPLPALQAAVLAV